jgi:predicted nucleic acid-binding protein
VIVLDTNVISELVRPQPEPRVVSWIAAQPRSELHATSVTKAEILLGIASLPAGRRKAGLAEAAERLFAQLLAGRVIPFDAIAAEHYAEVVTGRRRLGRPMGIVDAQIAAIALTAGASVATRDVAGFEGCGVEIINPWTAA